MVSMRGSGRNSYGERSGGGGGGGSYGGSSGGRSYGGGGGGSKYGGKSSCHFVRLRHQRLGAFIFQAKLESIRYVFDI